MNAELTRQLKGDEAIRPQVYLDSLGYSTIGIGRLVDSKKPGCGLRMNEMEFMLSNDIDDKTAELTKKLPWLYLLDKVRQGALLNMAFQMGVEGLLGFRTSLELVRKGEYKAAADNMLLSKWAQQTPNRAKRVAKQMETGVWQYADGT